MASETVLERRRMTYARRLLADLRSRGIDVRRVDNEIHLEFTGETEGFLRSVQDELDEFQAELLYVLKQER